VLHLLLGHPILLLPLRSFPIPHPLPLYWPLALALSTPSSFSPSPLASRPRPCSVFHPRRWIAGNPSGTLREPLGHHSDTTRAGNPGLPNLLADHSWGGQMGGDRAGYRVLRTALEQVWGQQGAVLEDKAVAQALVCPSATTFFSVWPTPK